jgi:hypothetical protein
VAVVTTAAGNVLAAPVADARPGFAVQLAQDTGQKVAPDTGPRRLVPRGTAPATDEPVQEKADPAWPKPTLRGRIEVDSLRQLNPDGAGTLDIENGGFGGDLWQGAPRSLVEQLLGRLPVAMISPVMRDMLRRLLLSVAVPPASAENDSAASLIVMRVRHLQSMGLLGSSSELIDVAPNRETDEFLWRLKVENYLLRNDLGGACAEAGSRDFALEELFWQQLLIYCQVLQGDADGAALGANLMAETDELTDPVFFALIDQLTEGGAAIVDSLGEPSPLLLSMLRTAKVQIPADAIANASPPMMGMIGASPNASIELRLEAAESAARHGALTPERLAEVYASVTFSRDDLDNALSLAEAAPSPRSRALLYQSALVQSVPTARAEVLQKAWSLARASGHYALLVRVFETLVVKMSPTGEMTWFAADAARALFALRRPFLAQRWMAALRQESSRDPEAKTALDSLWALGRLVGVREAGDGAAPDRVDGGAPDRGGDAASWRAAVHKMAPDRANLHIGDVYTLFGAIGDTVGADDWRALLGDNARRTAMVPAPAYRAALAAAAEGGRRGEAILLAALMIGAAGPGDMDLTMLAEIAVSLRRVGLDDEARDLVIEAAVQRGL